MIEKGVIHVNRDGQSILNYIVTYKCNNNCIMCIIEQPDRRRDLSLAEIKKRFDNIGPYVKYVFLTGGEPTIRKDLPEIISYLRSKYNGPIHLLTNARMFSYQDFCREFFNLDLGEFIFGVPIYGHTKELFESISRSKGSYEQTISGLKNLKKYGAKTELRIVVHKMNYENLPEIAEFIIGELNFVDSVLIASMEITGNALNNKEVLFVSFKEMKPYVQKAIDVLYGEIEISLNQFPLCIIDKKYRKLAEGKTVVEGEHLFVEECNECLLRDKCSGVWDSYLDNFGGSEFEKIKNEL